MCEKYLVFQYGSHCYAVENDRVERILSAERIWELPVNSKIVKGILRVNDTMAAVIDVEALVFHHAVDKETYILVLQLKDEYVGICASAIRGTYEIAEELWTASQNPVLPYAIRRAGETWYHLQLERLAGGDEHAPDE